MLGEGDQRCIIYELKEGAGEEYDQRHSAVWPEMRQLLRERGVHDYSIFRIGTLVISVYRTTDNPDAIDDEAKEEIHQRWTTSLTHLFERVGDESGRPLLAHRVFRLD